MSIVQRPALSRTEVLIAGQSLAVEAWRCLSQVRVQEHLGFPAQCELAFRDPSATFDPWTLAPPGTALQVGIRDSTMSLFQGEVTAIEVVHGPAREYEVRVRGYDLLHRLRKRQHVRAFTEVRARDIVRELVADLGLVVAGTEAGPLWPILVQHRQSDWDLLAETTEQIGLYPAVREGVLHLLTLEGMGATLPLDLGTSLLEACFEINGEPLCRSVTAQSWNPLRIESYRGQASEPRVGRRVDAQLQPDRLGSDGQRTLVHREAQSTHHTSAQAQAELDRRLAYEVTMHGTAEGDAALQPGAVVEVRGVARPFAGRYVLTTVSHTIDHELGYVSEISTVPPAPRASRGETIVALGMVTRVDDPQRLGRIRATLPTYGDIETEWMHVLTPGAGKGKGLIAMPDVGDRVLILCSHLDPGQGIVLGGLYGMDGSPDSGVEGNTVKRYTLLTPGGQRVTLDDERRTICLEDSNGSRVELGPDRVQVHAAVDMQLEAPGHSVLIRGQAIDFERG